MTPECRRADERLLDFVYEELPPEERAEVAAHVEACGRCAAELGSIGGTRALLRALPDEEPSQAVTARLLHEAAAPRTLSARLRAALSVFAVHPGWSLGAATAVVLVGSLVLFRDTRDGEVTMPGERDNQTGEAPMTAHEEVALPAPAQEREDKGQPVASPEAPVASPPAAASPSPSRSRARYGNGPAPKEASARPDDPIRKKSAPFVEMKMRQLADAEDPLGAHGSKGAGAAESAASAPSAPARPAADEVDELLMEAAGRPADEEIHRGADLRRARGDCPGALVLYRKLLRDYPKYARRTEVERSITACEVTRPATGTKNK